MKTNPGARYSDHPLRATDGQTYSLLDHEKQLARLQTLQTVSCKLNSTLDLEDALATVLDEAIRAVGAERGCLLLGHETTNKLEVRLSRRLKPSDLNDEPFRFSWTVIERVWCEGKPVLTANAAEDPELTKSDSVIKHTLRSILCVPLQSKDQRIGVLYLDNRLKTGQFQEGDLALTAAIADQAAIAINNANLHTELQRRLAEMQSTLAITRAMVSEVGLDSLLAFIMAQAEHLTNSQGAAVLLASDDGRSLEVAPSSESWIPMEAGYSSLPPMKFTNSSMKTLI